MEIGRKPASEGAQALEQALPIGRARDHELARTGGVDLDVVALLQLERFHDGSGETHGEAIAPSGNLHGGYTLRSPASLHHALDEVERKLAQHVAARRQQGAAHAAFELPGWSLPMRLLRELPLAALALSLVDP
jgi:hypothetical protein